MYFRLLLFYGITKILDTNVYAFYAAILHVCMKRILQATKGTASATNK
jgi:hypothetical protein